MLIDTQATSLYFHTFGRAFKVMALANDDGQANAFMERVPGASVIGEHLGLVIIADRSDEGRKL